MLTDKQKSDFSPLRIEIININILAHSFIRKLNRFSYLSQNTTRHHMFEEFVALRYIENGLILHLTNLDDDSSSSGFSFRSVAKEINRTHKDQKRINKFNGLLKGYRRDLNNLKKQIIIE